MLSYVSPSSLLMLQGLWYYTGTCDSTPSYLQNILSYQEPMTRIVNRKTESQGSALAPLHDSILHDYKSGCSIPALAKHFILPMNPNIPVLPLGHGLIQASNFVDLPRKCATEPGTVIFQTVTWVLPE
jgi:hypothetical protein